MAPQLHFMTVGPRDPAAPASAVMSAHPPHRDLRDDDPWGFGASDGVLVEMAGGPRSTHAGATHPIVHDEAHGDAHADPPAFRHRSPGLPDDAQRHSFVQRRRPRRLVRVAMVLGLMAGSGAIAGAWIAAGRTDGVAAMPPHGTLVLSSQPPGAAVLVDGVAAGTTPLAMDLTPGEHAVVATGGNGISEHLTAAIAAGESVARHLMLEGPADGAGPSPSAGPDASEATHAAEAPPAAAPAPPSTVTRAGRRAVPPGTLSAAASAAASPSAAALVPGSVRVEVPFAVRISEGGRPLGSGTGPPLRLSPGAHTLALVNEALGFRAVETVVVVPGQEARLVVEPQRAPLSVNALPWAEVFIEGRSFGETPLANLMLPIGTYQVTLTHPTLGERDVDVTVKLGAANRLAVNMRR